jgi:hypothetical protein
MNGCIRNKILDLIKRDILWKKFFLNRYGREPYLVDKTYHEIYSEMDRFHPGETIAVDLLGNIWYRNFCVHMIMYRTPEASTYTSYTSDDVDSDIDGVERNEEFDNLDSGYSWECQGTDMRGGEVPYGFIESLPLTDDYFERVALAKCPEPCCAYVPVTKWLVFPKRPIKNVIYTRYNQFNMDVHSSSGVVVYLDQDNNLVYDLIHNYTDHDRPLIGKDIVDIKSGILLHDVVSHFIWKRIEYIDDHEECNDSTNNRYLFLFVTGDGTVYIRKDPFNTFDLSIGYDDNEIFDHDEYECYDNETYDEFNDINYAFRMVLPGETKAVGGDIEVDVGVKTVQVFIQEEACYSDFDDGDDESDECISEDGIDVLFTCPR